MLFFYLRSPLSFYILWLQQIPVSEISRNCIPADTGSLWEISDLKDRIVFFSFFQGKRRHRKHL